jgi:lipid II:glycine glycyltransferase (peptidoglycan interpeptide bridge formation enzyme)
VKGAGKLVCVIPGGRLNVDGRVRYRSPVGASFGGFVFGGDRDLKTMFDAIGAFRRHSEQAGFSAAEITLPPQCYSRFGDQELEFAMQASGFGLVSREATSVVSLLTMEPDRFAPGLRRNLRQAERAGVEVRLGANISRFHSILTTNLAAKGAAPTHTAGELEKLLDLFPDRMLLFEGWLKDRMVGGCLCLACNEMAALAFYICDDPDFREFRVADRIIHDCLLWLKQRGYRYLDLGTISISGQVNWGLARFKAKFGGKTFVRATYLIEM